MNIAKLLTQRASIHPDKDALIVPRFSLFKKKSYQRLSFIELEDRSSYFAKGLLEKGIKKNDKILVFIKPGLDFPAMTFALFKLGAIPIFIDPGMGRVNLLKAIASTKPKALLCVPLVAFIKLFYRKTFKSVTLTITTLGFKKLAQIGKRSHLQLVDNIKPSDLAAILFTSGGTGVPKGVEYTHEIFSTQTKILQELFSLTSDDRDMPGFPLFALFTIAMGMTSCIPNMNPSKPAKSNPKDLLQNILDLEPTFVAGSPAIWSKLALYCIKHKITLPSIKYLVMFGAPMSLELHINFKDILPNGTTYTPYGATESLPVSCISGTQILENFQDDFRNAKGVCVGKSVPSVRIKIIKLGMENSIINHITDVNECSTFEMGEIIVSGKAVTKSYYNMSEKTKLSKIPDDNNTFWHRIGDLGYFDQDKNLWFAGRLNYALKLKDQVLSSIQCESIFNRHPLIKRSALIQGHKKESQKYDRPQIVLELENNKLPDHRSKNKIRADLKTLANQYNHTKMITDFYFIKKMPVDIRHNIKIDRNKLSQLAMRGKLL